MHKILFILAFCQVVLGAGGIKDSLKLFNATDTFQITVESDKINFKNDKSARTTIATLDSAGWLGLGATSPSYNFTKSGRNFNIYPRGIHIRNYSSAYPSSNLLLEGKYADAVGGGGVFIGDSTWGSMFYMSYAENPNYAYFAFQDSNSAVTIPMMLYRSGKAVFADTVTIPTLLMDTISVSVLKGKTLKIIDTSVTPGIVAKFGDTATSICFGDTGINENNFFIGTYENAGYPSGYIGSNYFYKLGTGFSVVDPTHSSFDWRFANGAMYGYTGTGGPASLKFTFNNNGILTVTGGLNSSGGVSATTGSYSSTMSVDSLYSTKGVTSGAGLKGTIGTFSSTVSVDSLVSTKKLKSAGLNSSGGVNATTGSYSSTMSVDSLYSTKGIRVDGKLGIGVSPTNQLDILNNQNAATNVYIKNTNDNAAAHAGYFTESNGSNVGAFLALSPTYSTVRYRDKLLVSSTGNSGLLIEQGDTLPIEFYTNTLNRLSIAGSGAITATGTVSVDSLYSTKGVTSGAGIKGTIGTFSSTVSVDSLFSTKQVKSAGLNSSGPISGTTGSFSSNLGADSIFVTKKIKSAGLNSSGGVNATTGSFNSTVSVDSLYSTKGVTSGAGIKGTIGTFSSTVSVDSLYSTKGIRVDGKQGIGMNPVYQVDITNNQTIGTYLKIKNTTDAVAAAAGLLVEGQGDNFFGIYAINTTHATPYIRDKIWLRSTGNAGMVIGQEGDLSIDFYTNALNRLSIAGSGAITATGTVSVDSLYSTKGITSGAGLKGTIGTFSSTVYTPIIQAYGAGGVTIKNDTGLTRIHASTAYPNLLFVRNLAGVADTSIFLDGGNARLVFGNGHTSTTTNFSSAEATLAYGADVSFYHNAMSDSTYIKGKITVDSLYSTKGVKGTKMIVDSVQLSSGTWLKNYIEGTFACSLFDGGGANALYKSSGTAKYVICGKIATIVLPSLTVTKDSSEMYFKVPPYLWPATMKYVGVPVLRSGGVYKNGLISADNISNRWYLLDSDLTNIDNGSAGTTGTGVGPSVVYSLD